MHIPLNILHCAQLVSFSFQINFPGWGWVAGLIEIKVNSTSQHSWSWGLTIKGFNAVVQCKYPRIVILALKNKLFGPNLSLKSQTCLVPLCHPQRICHGDIHLALLVGKLACHNLYLCGALKIGFLSRVSCLNYLHHQLLTGVIRIINSWQSTRISERLVIIRTRQDQTFFL